MSAPDHHVALSLCSCMSLKDEVLPPLSRVMRCKTDGAQQRMVVETSGDLNVAMHRPFATITIRFDAAHPVLFLRTHIVELVSSAMGVWGH